MTYREMEVIVDSFLCTTDAFKITSPEYKDKNYVDEVQLAGNLSKFIEIDI